MNQYLSEKIKILSAISILLVLYIHSGFHADEIEGMTINSYIQEFISGMIGRCAVPLFYIISGYLFFLKIPDGIYSIFEKMKKRIWTLLIPYIIGCMAFIVFYIAMDFIPGTAPFMNSSLLPIFDENFGNIVYAIFYDAGNSMPLAFQLWFLRDLIILVILSPVLYLLHKYLKWYWVLIVLILNYLPIDYFPIYALFWFTLGGSLTKTDLLINIKGGNLLIMPIIFLLQCLAQLFYPDLFIWNYIRIPIILLGVYSIWMIYDIVVPQTFSLQQHTCLTQICGFTFFIYLFHEPALNIVRKVIVFFLGKNETGYLISYLVSPWIFIIIAVIIGMILKKYVSKLYNIAAGGR
jgi:surface polysaccharide O-acyltransferase-like enzyme